MSKNKNNKEEQATQLVENIIKSIEEYAKIVKIYKENNMGTSTDLSQRTQNISTRIENNFQDLYDTNNFNNTTLQYLVKNLADRELNVEITIPLINGNYEIMQKKAKKTPLESTINGLQETFRIITGASDKITELFSEIARQKLTLIAYKTDHGYKIMLCSPEKIDSTLSRILPQVKYDKDIRINNCSYFGTGHAAFCEKYISDYKQLTQSNITIIPSISYLSLKQSTAAKEAKRQYNDIYKKIFQFFNKKNVPISLKQTSACKGNNFAFALSDNIDVKIDNLSFSTLNIINNMLFPNFHSKYADTIEKCFYNDNINNLNVSFTYPMLKQELLLHALPGSIGFATECIEKIFTRASNEPKEKQTFILNKILKSFNNTLNLVLTIPEKDNTTKTAYSFHNMKFPVNDEQFASSLTNIKEIIKSDKYMNTDFANWVTTSIDDFLKQDQQNAKSLTEILKSNKFYNSKIMSPTLAGFEVLETNKNKIKTFMEQHNITLEDLKNEKAIPSKQNEEVNKNNQNVVKNDINMQQNTTPMNNGAQNANEQTKEDTQAQKQNVVNDNTDQQSNVSLDNNTQDAKDVLKQDDEDMEIMPMSNSESDISLQILNDLDRINNM